MSQSRRSSTNPTNPSLLARVVLPENEGAWQEFVSIYSPMIARFCRLRLSADDFEEIHSRVLAALATAMKNFHYDPSRTFRGFLRTVVNNAVRRLHRDRKRHPDAQGVGGEEFRWQLEQLPDPNCLDEMADEIESDLHQRMAIAQRVMESVKNRVTPDNWQAFIETTVEGRTAPEVAERLGKSVASIYMARNRIFKLLRDEGKKSMESWIEEEREK